MNKNKNQAETFRRLVTPYINTLYKTAFRLTGSNEHAEDLVQDLLVKLYPKTEEIEKIQKLSPWLKKALYRQFIDWIRKRKTRPEGLLSQPEAGVEYMQTDNPDPEVLAQRANDRQRLQEALNRLDPENRSLVLMHLVEGYTLSELEKFFGVSSETLKTRIRRAKINLKNFLKM